MTLEAMAGFPSLLELAGRATIVFCSALVLAWLVRHCPAMLRHRLWTLTFLLLLVLPVLPLVGPSWDVSVPALPSRSLTGVVPVDPAGGVPFERLTDAIWGQADVGAEAPAAGAARPPRRSVSLSFLIWALGCAVVLGHAVLGILRFRGFVRSAEPVDAPEWQRHLEAVRNELGLRLRVRLLLGEEVVTPMTGGIRKPVILLPAGASHWSGARRRVVLAHELVHVRRRDALRQLLGRVVLALYWFHPLSWVALRLAAASREEACDEEVLALGARPSAYARHLLAVAENAGQDRAILALPIGHPSRLEKRIARIVRFSRPGRHGFVTAVVLTAIGAVGVSASCANPVPTPEIVDVPSGFDCALPVADDVSERSKRFSVAMAFREAALCMGFYGDVVIRDDGQVLAIAPGGSIVLQSQSRRLHQLVITQGPDSLEHAWSIDGRKLPFDEEARQWRDLVMVLLRDSYLGRSPTIGPDHWLSRTGISSFESASMVRGRVPSLQGEVADLLGRVAGYRAEQVSLRSALMTASSRGTRKALESEIVERRARIRELEERIEEFDLSMFEVELQLLIERYQSGLRGFQPGLTKLDALSSRLQGRNRFGEQKEALARLIHE